MKVAFIRPKPSPRTIGLQHLMIVEPLELEILAATLSSEHQVVIIDMILEMESTGHFIEELKPDVLCMTGYITHIPVIIESCRTARNNPSITG
ncbi:MAG: cobalamin B12-binding domain-containing protein [Bacteroidales bacterium]|nr:cobalamin B12-binding domain-containing protein [Bacteroidales bacterium]